ncbi:hypothetical protein DOM21_02945 [Bacteriovorax stolpii]|uniref:Uncharacterized protein n=1 Tax=Bacteriovorax stolpii TaxID=960 RepID=A0A2K9NVP5_BACTC|nr:hypothetical protein [Bacteriovorax stolpii]AUN99577.1 hypothetical protein C0V70_15980 [Bacteriovorax stolpii]QDK40427.1 hypothetical protein DOM21_02945 [Bacteriovorax stolpii]TDP51206.1 hypothetical protein C8D79_3377 [Bacteriovorax stolpii]
MNPNEEITLHQVLQIFTRRWKYLLMLALLFTLAALVKHKYFPMYPGTGKLIIKDVRNSQLQLVLSSVAGGNEVSPDAKGDDVVDRAETVLDTHEFYVALANRLIQIKNEQNSLPLKNFFKKFEGKETDPEFPHDVGNALSGILSFNSGKGGVLTINAKTYNRELSVIILNAALEEAQKNLIDRELEDLNRAENYFNEEIKNARTKLDLIENSTVRKLQKNQILSVDLEKGDSSKYISELKKNINDTKIAISNNTSKIEALVERIKKNGSRDLGVISKFNESSQIKMLEDENKDLQIQLQTYQTYLKTYENQKTGLVPMQYEIQKMNANHDFEYKMFASLNDSLARIGLQKTYVKNKVDILERERLSKVRSSPSLIIMILISLMLSQVIGMFSIYVYELFKPQKL